jgi:hypothetical protein
MIGLCELIQRMRDLRALRSQLLLSDPECSLEEFFSLRIRAQKTMEVRPRVERGGHMQMFWPQVMNDSI